MTINATHAPAPDQVAPSDLVACACHLYDAECALHAAHQSGVEDWITAAADKLHHAVADHLTAVAAAGAPHPRTAS